MEYLNQSLLFLFGDIDVSDLSHLDYPYLVFFISTAFIGLLSILLDFSYYKTSGGKSLFRLSYIGLTGTILMFTFWGIGSGIVGFFSARMGLIAFTVQASITMGLGWPLVFPRLYKNATTSIDEPEETSTLEIEEEPEEENFDEG